MKKSILIILLALPLLSIGQQINYSVKVDDPKSYPWLSINTDLIQLELIQNSIDAWSFNFGVWGYVEPINKFGATYNIKKSWLALGRLGNSDYPGNTDLQLGGYFYLFSSF